MTRDERDAAMYQLHLKGWSDAEIAKKYGLSQSWTNTIINLRKVSTGPAPLSIADAVLVRLYELTKLSPSQLRAKTRQRLIVRTRQVAMYAIKQRTWWSYPQVASYLHLKDHTTVMHGVSKIEELLAEGDEWIAKLVEEALAVNPVMPGLLGHHINAVDAYEALAQPCEPIIELEPEPDNDDEDDDDKVEQRMRLANEAIRLGSAKLRFAIFRYLTERRVAA